MPLRKSRATRLSAQFNNDPEGTTIARGFPCRVLMSYNVFYSLSVQYPLLAAGWLIGLFHKGSLCLVHAVHCLAAFYLKILQFLNSSFVRLHIIGALMI